jgi:hypothetical protein
VIVRCAFAPLAWVAFAGCAPSGTPLIAGPGLHLDDADAGGAGFAYRDLANDVFFVTPKGTTTKLASDTASSQFAGASLTIWFGLDAADHVIASMKVREPSGAVNAVGTQVATSSISGPPDGAHVSFESVANAATGTTDVHLDGAVVVAGASSTKSKWSKSGDVFLLGSKAAASTGGNSKLVQAFVDGNAASPIVLCRKSCAREVAVTNDGTRALYFDHDNNNAGNLELATLPTSAGATAALSTIELAGGVSDARIRLDESQANVTNGANGTSGANGANGAGFAYFLGNDVTTSAPDGSLFVISLTSQGNDARAVLPTGSGVVDVVDAFASFVVYATTAQDALSKAVTLRIVKQDGTADAALGSAALSEGFSGDGRFYVFRDGVRNDGNGHFIGTLRALDTSTGAIATLGEDARKAQLAGARAIAWSDDTKHLRRAALGGASELVQISVDTFDILGRSASSGSVLVYSIPAETNAGVWVLDLD